MQCEQGCCHSDGRRSCHIIHRAYTNIASSIEADDTIDLTVSYNGSLMTHGHKWQYGIGCVIEVMTGLAIDFQVMSLYCQRCAYASTRHGGVNTRGFIEWFRTNEPECNKNYEGSSGGMEMKAAELLWLRSYCGIDPPTETSATPPCSPAEMQGPSTISLACRCMETWSCRGRNASTTSPNDLALHCASWPRQGSRLASSSEVGASASSNRQSSTS